MKIKFIVALYILVSVTTLLFISCEDTRPELGSVRYMKLYDYNETQEQPLERFAVYVELLSDSSRIKNLSVRSIESDYIWNIENPTVVTDESQNKLWIGSSFLVSPQGTFANGQYSVVYTDFAEQEIEIYFSIDYDNSTEIIEKKSVDSTSIAIYDNQGSLLYFGDSTAFQTNTKILEVFPLAETMRKMSMSSDSKYAILEPVVNLRNGE